MEQDGGLVQHILNLPLFESEWVLWLLLGLSLISIAVMIERFWFFMRRNVKVEPLKKEFTYHLERGDLVSAAAVLKRRDSLQTNVVLAGLFAYQKGAESVEDLMSGALGREKARYEKRLSFLATLASNGPYIGLFGTVLGVIKSFRDLANNLTEASQSVMAGIAEALVATAVGLLVAIPAVIAFNWFKGRVKAVVVDGEMLARTLLANLKAVDPGS